MIPEHLPSPIAQWYPSGQPVLIGPPEGISEEDCGTIEVWEDQVQEQGVFDGSTVLRTFYKPTEQELIDLNNGGLVMLSFFNPQMVVHAIQAFTTEPDPAKENRGAKAESTSAVEADSTQPVPADLAEGQDEEDHKQKAPLRDPIADQQVVDTDEAVGMFVDLRNEGMEPAEARRLVDDKFPHKKGYW